MKNVRRTMVITVGLLALLLGLGFARAAQLPFTRLWLLASAPLGLFMWKRPKSFFVLFITLCFCVGWWRGSNYVRKLDTYQALYGKTVTLQGSANEDAVYGKQSQLAFTLTNIELLEPLHQKMIGQISVQGFGEPMVQRGDTVILKGKLFPTIGSKQGRMSFADITTIKQNKNLLEALRHRFIAGVQTALPEPAASFALGLLIGQRSTLPKDVAATLTAVGLTHIVAVSGYNLTILIRASQRLAAGRSRYQTAVASAILVVLFVVLVGSSPSIIRAALVSGFSIVAWYFGRTIKPLLLLSLVAALTAGYNPIYIWADISWYLSFLAFFGVLVVAPLLARKLTRKRKQPSNLALLLGETIAAQIMTVPIILYIFGRTSLISIPANLLVVPLVPLAMLLALIAGIAGNLVPVMSGLIALPARFALNYMLDISALFEGIPHVMVERSISVWHMLYMYGVILFIVVLLWRKNRENATITPKQADATTGQADKKFQKLGV
jgi:competence protein ComEC